MSPLTPAQRKALRLMEKGIQDANQRRAIVLMKEGNKKVEKVLANHVEKLDLELAHGRTNFPSIQRAMGPAQQLQAITALRRYQMVEDFAAAYFALRIAAVNSSLGLTEDGDLAINPDSHGVEDLKKQFGEFRLPRRTRTHKIAKAGINRGFKSGAAIATRGVLPPGTGIVLTLHDVYSKEKAKRIAALPHDSDEAINIKLRYLARLTNWNAEKLQKKYWEFEKARADLDKFLNMERKLSGIRGARSAPSFLPPRNR